ncbi:hypothetical protein DL764_005340 [Monosporascus ibericus]|uniref:AAA+ ATPase domain-containing protein n=1 Tax=Monosporascus ibericus TaxID=155417 RepID=A0A4Q4T9M8_9PEZI|nr:hypothetical protein DL764_005340 [Monosporascus ibericus]
MSGLEATSSPTQNSGPPGSTPKDDTQTSIDDQIWQNKDEPSDNAHSRQVSSEGKDPKPDGSHSAPEQEGRQSTKGDSKNNIVSSGALKLSKKISHVASILEKEIEYTLDECRVGFPHLEEQIEILRKVSKELNKEEKSDAEAGDGKDEWMCEVSKLTMDDWQKSSWNGDNSLQPVIQAYYRSVAPADQSTEHGPGLGQSRSECPQRVVINSQVLKSELEEISELNLHYLPVIMAPPFKLRNEQTMSKGVQPERSENRGTNRGITSPAILESARVSGDVPDHEHSSDAQHPVTSNQPAATHDTQNKDDMKREKEITTRIAQLQVLYDFIETELKYYLKLRTQVENGSLKTIAFEELWYLFEPGDVLYDQCQGCEQALKIYSVTGGQPRRRNRTEVENDEVLRERELKRSVNPRRYYDNSDEADSEEENTKKDALVEASGLGTWSPFTIDCYKMGFDGLRVGPVDSCRQIKHYSGEFKITDLPVYPLRFHERKDKIAANLEARGRYFLNSYGHKSYNGFTFPRTRGAYQEELRGDVFIDLNDFYRTRRRQRPKLGILRKSRPDKTEVNEYVVTDAGKWRMLLDHEVDEKITDDYMASSHTFTEPIDFELVQDSAEHLRLLPYEIPAFAFRTRSYSYVNISKLAEIDKSDEARDTGFDDLVIPEGHRDLLTALVQNHATGGKVKVDLDRLNKVSTQIEIVRGKGRGLIILLHGPPGSGKTSTAETIAAYTRRPLYSLTCGDLGTLVSDVEDNLKEHTDRAHRWGCVLLLDEADVFLTRRDWRDMGRNALVSVFLRELEYYSGILFLTTNRVGVIDEAFKSRIHISLRYPRIQQRETRQIWENILKRIERNNETSAVKIKFDRASLQEFAEKHYRKNEETETTWNGRQIRNAFQTAIALGQYEREKRLRAAGMTEEDASRSGQKTWMTVKLTRANFRSIAKTASEFEDYLASVRGPDSSLAKENHLRDDAHNPDAPVVRKDYGSGVTGRGKLSLLSPSPSKPMARHARAGSAAPRRSANEDETDDEDEGILDENLSDV